MAVEGRETRNRRPPLDGAGLEQLALRYVGRYATSRARLSHYLRRKVKERGWCGGGEPTVAAIVARMAELGYVDDRAFASARAASLGRRGYGVRRVGEALRAAGVAEDDSLGAKEEARAAAWATALRLAQRRGIGPFAAAEVDQRGRERALGVLLRAGHPIEVARRLAYARPGEIPDEDGA